MKKILFIALMVIASGAFISCHDDDEDNNTRSQQNNGTVVQQDTQTLQQRDGQRGETAD